MSISVVEELQTKITLLEGKVAEAEGKLKNAEKEGDKALIISYNTTIAAIHILLKL